MKENATPGKVAIVTGAGRGICKVVARRLAEAGWKVAVVDAREDRAKEAADELTRDGLKAVPLVCDVRDEGQVRTMVEDATKAFGESIGLLVNGAGMFRGNLAPHETPEEDWDAVLDSNLKGSFLCAKWTIANMLENGGGRIINIGSNAGRGVSPALGVEYTVAKAGVLGLTRHLAKHYGPKNILVNTIAPGPMDVERMVETSTAQEKEAMRSDIPVGRLGRPDDVAEAVVFIASSSGFINGASLDVNGGYIMY